MTKDVADKLRKGCADALQNAESFDCIVMMAIKNGECEGQMAGGPESNFVCAAASIVDAVIEEDGEAHKHMKQFLTQLNGLAEERMKKENPEKYQAVKKIVDGIRDLAGVDSNDSGDITEKPKAEA